MHLPFNEGYLKTLCVAFPDKEIIFAADSEHSAELSKAFVNNKQIKFKAVKSLKETLKGESEHNPLYALKAAKECWREILSVTQDQEIEQLTVLGAASPLLNVFSKVWQKTQKGKLFFVQHNQLATSMRWRSANPIFRYFDYISALKKGLPENQYLLTLELGLEEEIINIAPKMRGSILCLEHPVLESEWAQPSQPSPNGPIKVGFTGHCGRGKGLDTFISLAEQFAGEQFEFHAIGKLNEANAADLDTSILQTEPSRTHVEREEFLSKVRAMDIICLPLPNTTSYVSSGSIIDAFAALKPLVMTKNQSLKAIERKYGEFGFLSDSADELHSFFENFDSEEFNKMYEQWIRNTQKIRAARSEESLGATFTDTLENH